MKESSPTKSSESRGWILQGGRNPRNKQSAADGEREREREGGRGQIPAVKSGGKQRRNTRQLAIPNKNHKNKPAGAAARSEREAVGSSRIGAADEQPKIDLLIQLRENKQTNKQTKKKRGKKRLVRKAEENLLPSGSCRNRRRAGQGRDQAFFPWPKTEASVERCE